MNKRGKIVLVLIIFFIFPILFLACGKQGYEKNQKAIEERMKSLEIRIADLEMRIKKANSEPIMKKEVEEAIKAEDKRIVAAQEMKKNKPSYFNFPDYKIEIKDFNLRTGEGGVVEYYGNIVNKGNRNINDLSLTTEFYNESGNLIGGHSFPIKVIFANKERRFSNSDTVQGGSRNVYRYDIKVKYVVYEGGQLKEQEEEK